MLGDMEGAAAGESCADSKYARFMMIYCTPPSIPSTFGEENFRF